MGAASTTTAERMQRWTRRVLLLFTWAAGLSLALQAVVMVWARHELVPYEPVVALHCIQVARGGELYYDLNRYPYTIATYTPGYYLLTAALTRLGLPVVHAGRLISLLALLGVVWLCRRLLLLYTGDRYATWAGTLLVASTGNLAYWGTVCRVDMLALLFSLAAFYDYSQYRLTGQAGRLIRAGVLVVAAVFTKQTSLVAGAVILCLLAQDRDRRRQAAWFGACTGLAGIGLALGLEHFSGGRFFANTVLATLNPFSRNNLILQTRYLVLAGGCLVILALAGLRLALREGFHPLYAYLVGAASLAAATMAKVGSDLNYQLETMTLLGLCGGWSLYRLDFFPRLLRADGSTVTLLQIPLLLHLVVNLGVSGKTLLHRSVEEHMRRQEYASLRPYLEGGSASVLSVHQGPLLASGRPVEVEPFMYRLMVGAGRVDGEPLRHDLAQGKFGLVILYHDVFTAGARDPDLCTLPDVHLDQIRQSYRLAGRVPGPALDNYLYQPQRSPEPPAAALERLSAR